MHDLAHVAELVGRLEPRILRHGQLRGLVHQRAIGHTAPARLVDDRIEIGVHLVERHAPLVGAGLHEHLAGGRARLAEHLDVVAHAAAPSVALGARDGVGVELGIGGGLVDTNLVEIGVELVGHDSRHRRERALTHLDHRVDDGHEAVAVYRNPLVGRQGARLRAHRVPARRGQVEAHDEARAHREASFNEGAPADPGLGGPGDGHYAPPFLICAARWMPARMR